ncbi:hypothetical protein OG474_02045 [Kribbella sp. NBC_01505]|uniref:hypothetical protein n=1 Tax=Kribbella sp. NBC_01505 TaxID=2903580 RepID=UPI00386BEB57
MPSVRTILKGTVGGAAFVASVGAIVYLAACDPYETKASDESLAELCKPLSRTLIPNAPPYEGPVPHPIMLFGGGAPSLASGKQGSAAWDPKPADVQLVACYGTSTDGRVTEHMCHFDLPSPKDLRLQGKTEHVSVYEVRGRRKIGEVAVEATDCPSEALTIDGSGTAWGVASSAAVRRALSAFVGDSG